jgi:hypothetical protein
VSEHIFGYIEGYQKGGRPRTDGGPRYHPKYQYLTFFRASRWPLRKRLPGTITDCYKGPHVLDRTTVPAHLSSTTNPNSDEVF